MSLAGVVFGHTVMATSTIRMTLYLWHMPLLLSMHLVFDYLGLDRYDPSTPGFIELSILHLALMATLVATAFVALRPLENSPLPLWDGGSVNERGIRSAAVGLLLCTAGAASLTSVAWGLKGSGPLLCRGDAGCAGHCPVAGQRYRVAR